MNKQEILLGHEGSMILLKDVVDLKGMENVNWFVKTFLLLLK
jgi:hypothetical protein